MAAPPPRGLSLYDNLHDPNDPSPSATISSAPVTYKQGGSTAGDQAAKKPLNNAALQFQPIRRPQVKQPKAKTTFPKAIPRTAPAAASATAPAVAARAAQSIPHQSTLADWAVTEEDEWMYGIGEKRQRGGRKKRKKRQEEFETNWDEMYDPTRPTNVDEFLKSDEKVEEVREWKALLYRHRKRQEESDLSDSDEETAPPPRNRRRSICPPSGPLRPTTSSTSTTSTIATTAPNLRIITTSRSTTALRRTRHNSNNGANDEDDDDAGYSPPPTFNQTDQDANNTPEDTDTQQQRTNRPGQAGFAQRLMSKYGWTKGAALGANESGILNPLRVQVEKRRKRADADGGGWADPANKAKIIGGRRKDGEGASKFGPMSEVIVLRNMLDNMPDLEAEIADGLGQEIGEECGDKYGRVERLYIDVETRQVFIKFTDQVSALRAVNELDGRVFNGNNIIPKFYDTEQFEKGIYVDTTS
ncbi:hypothetical protein BBK36DRAFT_1191515 [Trichoderma citrinoviride]|uniref:G-patch domain-containing protein n=1 Tax=Trichoderma citrinoviride TaxID=58853 RepID=A0A2T4BH84_9HYPO|nr:hypothetical protein BBK36DRAFT_1191515 [Trichoderma citrinoviride]PTB68675.1 hypothetical protein BBK36DRAFT_1191515 [Trichoderma citrinoviride]